MGVLGGWGLKDSYGDCWFVDDMDGECASGDSLSQKEGAENSKEASTRTAQVN
jgi:hypothetical protein